MRLWGADRSFCFTWTVDAVLVMSHSQHGLSLLTVPSLTSSLLLLPHAPQLCRPSPRGIWTYSYYLPGNLIANTNRDKVEDGLSNMIFPVVFSDSVPAKTTWAAGLHLIYLVIILVLFCQDAFSDRNRKCRLKHFIFPLKQLSHKQIILHQKVHFHTGGSGATLFNVSMR